MSSVDGYSDQGKRPYQEDRYLVHRCPEGHTLVCVADGHGGAVASDYVVTRIGSIFDEQSRKSASVQKVLRRTFRQLDRELRTTLDGTTVSLLYVKDNTAFISILGDSPVLISTQTGALFIPELHSARTHERDAKKIELEHRCRKSPPWVTVRNGYLLLKSSSLAVTRALGDADFGDVLIRTPDLYQFPLSNDSIAILATDGIDDISKKRRRDFEPPHGHYEMYIGRVRGGDTAQELVKTALEYGSQDNVTMVVYRHSLVRLDYR